jgi:hypothetical protein
MEPRAPGWISKFVKSHRNALARQTGMLVDEAALGCGHYGCVYPTEDPRWVVKITHDVLTVWRLVDRVGSCGVHRFPTLRDRAHHVGLRDIRWYGLEPAVGPLCRLNRLGSGPNTENRCSNKCNKKRNAAVQLHRLPERIGRYVLRS